MTAGSSIVRRLAVTGLLLCLLSQVGTAQEEEPLPAAEPLAVATASVRLHRGLNLVALPLEPLATGPVDSDLLLGATGANWIVRIVRTQTTPVTTPAGIFQLYAKSLGLPAFPLRASECYLVHVSSERTWTLTGTAWRASERSVLLDTRLASLGLPPDRQTSGTLDLAELADARVGWEVRADANGRGHFEVLSGQPGASPLPSAVWIIPSGPGVVTFPGPRPADRAPVVTAPLELTGAPGASIRLRAAAFDPEGGTLTYAWVVREGSGGEVSPREGPTSSFAARDAGTYVVQVTAHSSAGGSAGASTTIHVSDGLGAARGSLMASAVSTAPRGFWTTLVASFEDGAGAPVADGTLVLWRTSRGVLSPSVSETAGGTAQVRLELFDVLPEELEEGLFVGLLASSGRAAVTTAIVLASPRRWGRNPRRLGGHVWDRAGRFGHGRRRVFRLRGARPAHGPASRGCNGRTGGRPRPGRGA
ncbi:MAG: PKD domain-containing protein [Candidatus Riflebacteria bacterium]|nr:PKD domain-containing protein [Candidatus Riflebacteria bacterium]